MQTLIYEKITITDVSPMRQLYCQRQSVKDAADSLGRLAMMRRKLAEAMPAHQAI